MLNPVGFIIRLHGKLRNKPFQKKLMEKEKLGNLTNPGPTVKSTYRTLSKMSFGKEVQQYEQTEKNR